VTDPLKPDRPEPPATGESKSRRLERLILSPEFRVRANAAVAKAIAYLETKGIKPTYIVRERRPRPAPGHVVISDSERHALRDAVRAIKRSGRAYAVRLGDIPEPYRAVFENALYGSGRPAIEAEGPCAYAQDWLDWLDGKFPRWQ
jgi:hypothetical protein